MLDQQANTKATIILREIITGGIVGDLSATTVLAQDATPTATVASGTYWFDNTINSLDLYKVAGGAYAPTSATYSSTEPTGASAGDVWVDTTLAAENQANERAYPKLYVRNTGNTAWVLHDNTDQTTNTGVLFADIDDTAGGGAPIAGAPNANVYPAGMLVVNMAQLGEMVQVIMQMVADVLADMHNVVLLQLQCKRLLLVQILEIHSTSTA